VRWAPGFSTGGITVQKALEDIAWIKLVYFATKSYSIHCRLHPKNWSSLRFEKLKLNWNVGSFHRRPYTHAQILIWQKNAKKKCPQDQIVRLCSAHCNTSAPMLCIHGDLKFDCLGQPDSICNWQRKTRRKHYICKKRLTEALVENRPLILDQNEL